MTQEHHADPGFLARSWQRIVHAFSAAPDKRDDNIPGDGANTTMFGGMPTEIGAEPTVQPDEFWDSRDDSSVFPDLVKERQSRDRRA